MTYYNDNDKFVCQWTRNLIAAGHITKGTVDERSITELRGSDLAGYERVHLFSGIAGWEAALNLAGWEGPVWTASCPCQPLSCAGRRKGHADERHLWPALYSLIAECKPATVFGEQVAGKDGREWFAGVRADLEGIGYAVGAADLCAAGVGAAHKRQRIFWVANTNQEGFVHTASWTTCATCNGFRTPDMAGRPGNRTCPGEPKWFEDGTCRRTKPGVALLVDAIPGRMESCAAYGNAIVPQVAAQFISAVMECL